MFLADKISDAEFEVMKILWREAVPVSSVAIRKELQETMRWEKSTILTLLRRLTDKKVISVEKKDIFYYSPNVLEKEYKHLQTQGLLNKLYGGKVKNLIAALCDADKLSGSDINELKEYFKMEENK